MFNNPRLNSGILGSFGGTRIFTVNNWQQVEDGTEIIQWPAHSIIKWLSKFFPIDPYVEGEYIKYVDAPPIMMDNNIYCSHAQHSQLKEKTK